MDFLNRARCRSHHRFRSVDVGSGEEVRCIYQAGHPADGSDCFAFHMGPPERWLAMSPPPDVKKETMKVRRGGASMRRVWTDDDDGAITKGKNYRGKWKNPRLPPNHPDNRGKNKQ